ncbi:MULTISPECIES: hypothetical protein [Enterococcus]|uniref:hypothetical protein n=1 Tax=Enterococcus TaxID=1350 RepID=UPI00065E6AD1|nr:MULTISPECIES: hypothetical protein [Enterococcus]KAF1302956.1 hypothetical protein BAU16_05635 [Enterococcus sp. JM9B]
MKTSTKVTIGLSIAAVAGITTVAVVSDKLVNKLKRSTDRRKVRKFVDDKFHGNERLLDVVDNLTDEDLDSLMNIMHKIKDSRKQISVYGENVKDTTELLRNKLMSFIDSVF